MTEQRKAVSKEEERRIEHRRLEERRRYGRELTDAEREREERDGQGTNHAAGPVTSAEQVR